MILINFISHCINHKCKSPCGLKVLFGEIDQNEFRITWSHVNTDYEVTLHRSEILPQSEISNQYEFTSGLF